MSSVRFWKPCAAQALGRGHRRCAYHPRGLRRDHHRVRLPPYGGRAQARGQRTAPTGAAEGEKIRAEADRQRDVIIANAYRDAQKVKGEGDAEAARVYAESFGKDPQFAQFYRSLDAYKESFSKKSDVMVFDPSQSDFFKTYRNGGAAGK